VSREVFALDLDHAEAILPRYDRPAPRYTSYPTAPVWKEDYGPAQLIDELGRTDVDPDDGLSIYVHVPFCSSLCHFCACNRFITNDPAIPERYIEGIAREVETVRRAIRVPRTATQQHWGGGTPTHLTPAQVKRLYGIVADAFPMRSDAEISIEVDPRVTTDEHLAALRECGFNRISMGVQDFDPRVQEAVHRIQPLEMTAPLVENARRAGFESVNLDLIYGLPYQREETFSSTLDEIFAIGPDRIALYSYAHVTWVAKQQRGFERKDLPDPGTKLRIMLLAIRRFLEEGYLFIGLDHFARPDDELSVALRERTLRRNFMGHTTQAGVDLLGFGASAISELRGSYAQSHRELETWHQALRETGVATMRGHFLSEEDIERRWIIQRLICLSEVRSCDYREAFGGEFGERYREELEQLEPAAADGLVVIEGDGSFAVTPLGRLLVRNVAMVFDAYLPEQERSGKRIFSKAV
jgi:oxygen-independent coproporphyrinogen-3 oxidase